MKHAHYSDVEAKPVTAEGSRKATVRWLIGPTEAPNFSMRRFELKAGGNTPLHDHPWEHEIYFLEGEGSVRHETGSTPVKAGDVMLVQPGEEHGVFADADVPLVFLCMIPNEGAEH
jgi:quercetin dioxygenase-like cupin family protein